MIKDSGNDSIELDELGLHERSVRPLDVPDVVDSKVMNEHRIPLFAVRQFIIDSTGHVRVDLDGVTDPERARRLGAEEESVGDDPEPCFVSVENSPLEKCSG